MKWTKTVPKKSGAYWRKGFGGTPVISQVLCDEENIYVNSFGFAFTGLRSMLRKNGFEWYGPLVPPQVKP